MHTACFCVIYTLQHNCINLADRYTRFKITESKQKEYNYEG